MNLIKALFIISASFFSLNSSFSKPINGHKVIDGYIESDLLTITMRESDTPSTTLNGLTKEIFFKDFRRWRNQGQDVPTALRLSIQTQQNFKEGHDGELNDLPNALIDTGASVLSKVPIYKASASDLGLDPLLDYGAEKIKDVIRNRQTNSRIDFFIKNNSNNQNIKDLAIGIDIFTKSLDAYLAEGKTLHQDVRRFFVESFGFDISTSNALDRQNKNLILREFYEKNENKEYLDRQFSELVNAGASAKDILEYLKGNNKKILQHLLENKSNVDDDRKKAAEREEVALYIKDAKRENQEFNNINQAASHFLTALAPHLSNSDDQKVFYDTAKIFKFTTDINKRLNADGLSLFKSLFPTGTNQKPMSNMASAALTMDLFAIGLNLVSSFMSSGPSFEQQLMEAIQDLFEYIKDFRIEVNNNFDILSNRMTHLKEELEDLQRNQNFYHSEMSQVINRNHQEMVKLYEAKLIDSLTNDSLGALLADLRADSQTFVYALRKRKRSPLDWVKQYSDRLTALEESPMLPPDSSKLNSVETIYDSLKNVLPGQSGIATKNLAGRMLIEFPVDGTDQQPEDLKRLAEETGSIDLNNDTSHLIKRVTDPSYNPQANENGEYTLNSLTAVKSKNSIFNIKTFNIYGWFESLSKFHDELTTNKKELKHIKKDALKLSNYVLKVQHQKAKDQFKLGSKESHNPLLNLTKRIKKAASSHYLATKLWREDELNPIKYLYEKSYDKLKQSSSTGFTYKILSDMEKRGHLEFFKDQLKKPNTLIENMNPEILFANDTDLDSMKQQIREWINAHEKLPLCTPKLYSQNKTVYMPEQILGERVWDQETKDKLYEKLTSSKEKLNYFIAYHTGLLPDLKICGGVHINERKISLIAQTIRTPLSMFSNQSTINTNYYMLNSIQKVDIISSLSLVSKGYSLSRLERKTRYFKNKPYRPEKKYIGPQKGWRRHKNAYKENALDRKYRDNFFPGRHNFTALSDDFKRTKNVHTRAWKWKSHERKNNFLVNHKYVAYQTFEVPFSRSIDFRKIKNKRSALEDTTITKTPWEDKSVSQADPHLILETNDKIKNLERDVTNNLAGFFKEVHKYGRKHPKRYSILAKEDEFRFSNPSFLRASDLTADFIEKESLDKEKIKDFFVATVSQDIDKKGHTSQHFAQYPARITAALYYADLRESKLENVTEPGVLSVDKETLELSTNNDFQIDLDTYNSSAKNAAVQFAFAKPPYIQSWIDQEIDEILILVKKSYSFWLSQCEASAQRYTNCKSDALAARGDLSESDNSRFIELIKYEERDKLISDKTRDSIKSDLKLLGSYRLAFDKSLDSESRKNWIESVEDRLSLPYLNKSKKHTLVTLKPLTLNQGLVPTPLYESVYATEGDDGNEFKEVIDLLNFIQNYETEFLHLNTSYKWDEMDSLVEKTSRSLQEAYSQSWLPGPTIDWPN